LKSGQILTQAKLFRLDESDSRLSEASSPRRGFAQEHGWVFWPFRSEESCSPKRKIPDFQSVPTCRIHEIYANNPNSTQIGDPSIEQTQIHAIKGIKDNYI